MKFIRIEGNDVSFIHHIPFDTKHGLGMSKEQLLQEGFLVEAIPNPLDQTGKVPVMKFNKSTNEVYYEYEERPLTTEEQMQQDLGNILFESAMDKQKIAELESMTGNLLMEVATLKTGGNA